MIPPLQLAVAASQPAATIAILPPVQTAVGAYRHLKWWQGSNRRFKRRFVGVSANVESDYLFS
jgi:hypothetical protein